MTLRLAISSYRLAAVYLSGSPRNLALCQGFACHCKCRLTVFDRKAYLLRRYCMVQKSNNAVLSAYVGGSTYLRWFFRVWQRLNRALVGRSKNSGPAHGCLGWHYVIIPRLVPF